MFLQGFNQSHGVDEILQFRPIVWFKQVGTSNDNDGVVEIVVDVKVVKVDNVVVVNIVDDDVAAVVDVVEIVVADDVVVEVFGPPK